MSEIQRRTAKLRTTTTTIYVLQPPRHSNVPPPPLILMICVHKQQNNGCRQYKYTVHPTPADVRKIGLRSNYYERAEQARTTSDVAEGSPTNPAKKMDSGTSEDHLVVNLPHHIQQDLCTTRATYRQGKKLTAVKVVGGQVYTVNQESQHLLIYRVPQINLQNELRSLCERYGELKIFHKLELEHPEEEFTEIFHASYSKMHSARKAKRFLDGRSFYGSLLHVCYAPELESVDETRIKLINRRNEIAYFTGRRLNVPKIDGKITSKRRAPVSRDLHRNKILRRAPPRRIESLNEGGPSCLDPGNLSATPSSLEATTLPSLRLPKATQSADFDVPGISEGTFVIGPYDVLPSYPSQQIHPCQEMKKARDQKLMPTSVLRRNPSSVSTNKIIFHKKNAS